MESITIQKIDFVFQASLHCLEFYWTATSRSGGTVYVRQTYVYCPGKSMVSQIQSNRRRAPFLMKLVIFDLDGTLTQTNEVDDLCFPRAFAENLGVADLNTDWSSYTHSTDTVVFQEAFAKRFGRSPTAQEAQAFEQRFVESLAELYASRPEMFAEVRGATALLRQLEQDSQWAIAIATGCWKRSAEFKINAAELPASGLPRASAEDGPSREAIVESAISRAMAYYEQEKFANIVLVGDRIWDAKTAQTLRLPFIGVATAERAELLRQAGANFMVENYLNAARFLEYLDQARVPLIA